MKMSKNDSKNIIVLASIVIGIYWISQNLQYAGTFVGWLMNVISPLLIAGIIAFIINIPMTRFEKIISKLSGNNKKIGIYNRGISLILSFFSIIALISLMLSIVIPEVLNTFALLASAIPIGFQNGIDWATQYSDLYPQAKTWLEQLNPDWVNIAQQVFDYSKSGLFGVFGTTFSFITTLANITFTFIISIMISIYMLLSKEKLFSQTKRFMVAYFPEKINNNILHIVNVADEAFSNFIIGKCIDAIVVGLMCTGGMLLLHIPYAVMIGAIVGVTALVPIVGGYIGLIIGAFLILMVSPVQALKFIIYLLIMQTFEGNVIYPKIIGNTVGLPPMWILISVTLGGTLLGIPGMLIGVPFVSTIYTILGEHIDYRLNNKITVEPNITEIILNKKNMKS
ncbi:AI-2E family transporter [[Clostridium] fimetarium]|uniref:Predicted PurR-regulated permease PerM n=1 Tax=[Clostridium] fimetarium TaxID=99656 RepID=A0A1I0QAE8_9FIRM|nr:AI-2E family transporter [[Clostridium] fimetarium]SEW23972.1 Predicted PurR-regulated permease PerM [[Clostridium] fimetarium]